MRLHMNIGEASGATRDEIIRAIQGETGLPSSAIGAIDLRERHAFVDVVAEHANAVASKLSRSRFKEQKLKARVLKKQEEE